MTQYPPFFATCSGNAGLTALIGTNPVRCYLFGEADPPPPEKPYMVWQVIGGAPENHLSGAPVIGLFTTQVDIYGQTAASARAVSAAFQTAIASAAYVTGYGGEYREADTGLYRLTITVDWFTD